jgi:hypothetical protein
MHDVLFGAMSTVKFFRLSAFKSDGRYHSLFIKGPPETAGFT